MVDDRYDILEHHTGLPSEIAFYTNVSTYRLLPNRLIVRRSDVVTAILRAGQVAQFVVIKKKCGNTKVVKIISRLAADMNYHISQEVKWLQSPAKCDSR